MAKIAKKKQSISTANPRSRAAKRATSPSINVDKSIKEVPRVLGTSPMLGSHKSNGVTKKKKAKQMTRGQRARQEKGLARAEAVMDQMEKKVDNAKSKLRTRNTRKALWEDINESTTDEQKKPVDVALSKDTAAEEVPDGEGPQDVDNVDMGSTESQGQAEAAPIASLREQLLAQSNDRPSAAAPQMEEVDLIT